MVLALVAIPGAGVIAALAWVWNGGLGIFDVALFGAAYLFTGFGVTVGYHRLFAHRAFRAPGPVRFGLAVAGSMAVQGPVLRWVADHRRHHRFSDRKGDPHSPHPLPRGRLALRRLARAHLGWFFEREKTRIRRFAGDVLADPVVRFVDRLYVVWVSLSLGIPAVVGYAVAGSQGAQSGFLLAGLARVFAVQHVTWSVNSICHCFGSRPFRTEDHSRNNWLVALPSLGEGWHNNHHAFPTSARQGLEPWQLDPSYWLIRCLERVGLATRVRLPSAASRRSRAAGPTSATPASERGIAI